MITNTMDENKGKKAYAHAQASEKMTLDEFAEHISSHNCVYDKADVSAVLVKAVKCLRELLLDGKKVSLGDLGEFYATVGSEGANSVAEFENKNVTSVSAVWDKGERLKEMLADAALQQVTTRATQKASLKAHKAGQTSASWDTADVNDGEGDSQVDTGNGTGSGTGTGTGTGTDTGTGTGAGTDTGTGTGDDLGGNVG